MKELWRPIPDYEALYEVSTFGRVRRIAVATKLSLDDLEAIRQARTNGESFLSIAKRFAISDSTIFSALKYQGTFSFRTPNRVLKPQKTTQGYRSIALSKNGKVRQYRIHTLVATTFLGPIPPKWCVNHKNGIKHDNRLENLEIVSKGDDLRHTYHVLGRPPGGQKGSVHIRAKLHEHDIPTIRTMLAQGLTTYAVAALFAVSQSAIQHIHDGKAWRHVT